MKKFLLLFLLIGYFLQGYSQEYQQKIINTIVWQADAKSGGKFVGIANDAYEASIAIDEVKFIMEGTKYQILHSDINEIPILYDNEKNTKEDFVSDDEYLKYKYISEIELIALEYLEKNNYNQAVSFYTSVCKQKNVEKVTKHLTNLRDGYSKYLFERETPAVLVSYSE